jgi:hypothetical protein
MRNEIADKLLRRVRLHGTIHPHRALVRRDALAMEREERGHAQARTVFR